MKTGTHFTTSVYIVSEDKVLLHVHKRFGIIIPVGGYIEEGEIPEQAAIREVQEGTGLDVQIVNEDLQLDDGIWHQAATPMTMAYIKAKLSVTQIDMTFAGTIKSADNLGAGEIGKDMFVLLDKTEIIENKKIAPNVRHFALKALELAR